MPARGPEVVPAEQTHREKHLGGGVGVYWGIRDRIVSDLCLRPIRA